MQQHVTSSFKFDVSTKPGAASISGIRKSASSSNAAHSSDFKKAAGDSGHGPKKSQGSGRPHIQPPATYQVYIVALTRYPLLLPNRLNQIVFCSGIDYQLFQEHRRVPLVAQTTLQYHNDCVDDGNDYVFYKVTTTVLHLFTRRLASFSSRS